MPDETLPSDGRLLHPTVRTERTDVDYRWILGILLALAVLAVVIHFAVLFFLRGYRDYQDRVKRSSFPLAPTTPASLPAEPRLEQLDRLEGIRRENVYERVLGKEEVLDRYGKTSEEGYVHIPVTRAMALLENKLPVRKEPPAGSRSRSNGLVNAGASNSGRLFREKP